MSQSWVRARTFPTDLYVSLAEALARVATEPHSDLTASGFVDPVPREDPGHWRPLGELPEHIFDRGAAEGMAKFCLFGGRAYVGVRGGAFTDFEREKRAGTMQPLTLILNGCEAVDIAYRFDGRSGWTCFPVDIAATPAGGGIHSVEIERDGKLLFSRRIGADAASRSYRASVWLINAAGRLHGSVNGASSDVAVEIRVGAKVAWTISNLPAEAGRPRPFELDLAAECAEGMLAKVSVRNPATGAGAMRSPLGVFVSQGVHFVLANPRIGEGTCRAVLLFWREGRRRRLSLGYARDLTLDAIARVDLDDPAEARFEGGDNSFIVDLDVLRSGEAMILDEDGSVLGRLPPLDQILALAGPPAAQAPEPTMRSLVALAQDAVSEGNWQEAVERWTVCIATFGDKPHWLSNRARALLAAGRLAEAEREYVSLAERFADSPHGMVGLAWLAHERKDWSGAVSTWTQCLERFPDDRRAQWTAAKADALHQLGRFAEAERLLRGLAARHPAKESFAKARIRAAIEHAHMAGRSSARHDELCEEIEAHFPAEAGTGDLIEGMQLFSRLGDCERARRRLLIAVPRASSAQEIEMLLRAVGELVEAGSRGPLWERLLAAARPVSVEMELRLLLAQERFEQFARRFDEARGALSGSANLGLLEPIRVRLGRPRGEVFAEPKVFGIGLSRTGTLSLTEALRVLGVDAAHWINPLTFQLIGATDVHLFGACTDISVAQDFEKLYYQYPNARFVWTRRSLTTWTASITRHYEFWHRSSGIAGLRRELERGVIPFGLSRAAIEFGLYLNSEDFGAACRTFEQRIRSFFRDKPAEKLLELDIAAGQGWSELCTFLGAAVPDQPFPHANKGT